MWGPRTVLREMGLSAVFLLPAALIDEATRGLPAVQWTEELAVRMLAADLSADAVARLALEVVPGTALPAAAGADELVDAVGTALVRLSPALRDSRLERLWQSSPPAPTRRTFHAIVTADPCSQR